MKKIFTPFFLLSLVFSYSQVGINTEVPRGILEVNGDIIANDYVFPKNLESVNDEIKDLYYLLVQSQDETKNIQLLDIEDSKSPGIAALVTFRLHKPDGDWIQSFNTKIDATKYALVVLSGYFTHNVGSGSNNALPGIGAYIKENVWYINADYPSLNNLETTEEYAWIIRCSIYHKNYVKIFNQQNIDMNNSGTKTASTPLLK
ncbi:MAG TPA: hypothetical protein VIG94_10300 [Faecalibacter sp.]